LASPSAHTLGDVFPVPNGLTPMAISHVMWKTVRYRKHCFGKTVISVCRVAEPQ